MVGCSVFLLLVLLWWTINFINWLLLQITVTCLACDDEEVFCRLQVGSSELEIYRKDAPTK